MGAFRRADVLLQFRNPFTFVETILMHRLMESLAGDAQFFRRPRHIPIRPRQRLTNEILF